MKGAAYHETVQLGEGGIGVVRLGSNPSVRSAEVYSLFSRRLNQCGCLDEYDGMANYLSYTLLYNEI